MNCPRCGNEMALLRSGRVTCLSSYCVPALPYGGVPSVNRKTSKEAAETLIDSAGSLRARILSFIVARDSRGATCDEVEVALGLRHQTASARIRELFLLGRIKDGEWERRTRSNRWAVVWVDVEAA